MQRQSQYQSAIDQIAEEKGIDKKVILETIDLALAAAYRKDYGTPEQNIVVHFTAETGDIAVFDQKTVVDALTEDMEKKSREYILLADAQAVKPDAAIGDVLTTPLPLTGEFGRIAAQTAKQVIIQRIREAEREAVFSEYQGKEYEIVNASVQRVEGKTVLLDLGHTVAIMPPHEQLPREEYATGQRIKVMILEVRSGFKGPEVVVSRAHARFIEKLFAVEVPEIAGGTVVIDAIAREAGNRTKMAVHATQEGIDPVGACVGQRGTRVQTVLAEISGEKIDIIEYDADPARFIAHALSPAKVLRVDVLDEAKKEARAIVQDDQLSLAIGKGGQNVRLAVKLSGWKIDVVSLAEITAQEEKATGKKAAPAVDAETPAAAPAEEAPKA